LVCNSTAIVLTRNGPLYARFAEKLSRINVRLLPSNLGVANSSRAGRTTTSTGQLRSSHGTGDLGLAHKEPRSSKPDRGWHLPER
jgi:hypothetical protein